MLNEQTIQAIKEQTENALMAAKAIGILDKVASELIEEMSEEQAIQCAVAFQTLELTINPVISLLKQFETLADELGVAKGH